MHVAIDEIFLLVCIRNAKSKADFWFIHCSCVIVGERWSWSRNPRCAPCSSMMEVPKQVDIFMDQSSSLEVAGSSLLIFQCWCRIRWKFKTPVFRTCHSLYWIAPWSQDACCSHFECVLARNDNFQFLGAVIDRKQRERLTELQLCAYSQHCWPPRRTSRSVNQFWFLTKCLLFPFLLLFLTCSRQHQFPLYMGVFLWQKPGKAFTIQRWKCLVAAVLVSTLQREFLCKLAWQLSFCLDSGSAKTRKQGGAFKFTIQVLSKLLLSAKQLRFLHWAGKLSVTSRSISQLL